VRRVAKACQASTLSEPNSFQKALFQKVSPHKVIHQGVLADLLQTRGKRGRKQTPALWLPTMRYDDTITWKRQFAFFNLHPDAYLAFGKRTQIWPQHARNHV